MNEDRPRREGEPFDRLTRLAEAMTDALEAHPERGTERCVIFLDTDERGGLQMYGFTTTDNEAIAAVFQHLRAIFRANGKELLFAPLGRG